MLVGVFLHSISFKKVWLVPRGRQDWLLISLWPRVSSALSRATTSYFQIINFCSVVDHPENLYGACDCVRIGFIVPIDKIRHTVGHFRNGLYVHHVLLTLGDVRSTYWTEKSARQIVPTIISSEFMSVYLSPIKSVQPDARQMFDVLTALRRVVNNTTSRPHLKQEAQLMLTTGSTRL